MPLSLQYPVTDYRHHKVRNKVTIDQLFENRKSDHFQDNKFSVAFCAKELLKTPSNSPKKWKQDSLKLRCLCIIGRSNGFFDHLWRNSDVS